MKYLTLFSFLVLTLLLVGCDALGIEVTTVKGYWESNKFMNGLYCALRLDDDKFSLYAMVTDSTYSKKWEGTWLCKDDTISLYTQEKGSTDIIIKKLSQNSMTLQTDGKNYLIMSRVPNAEFDEVLKLKGGFWYYVYITIMITLCLVEGYAFFVIFMRCFKKVGKNDKKDIYIF